MATRYPAIFIGGPPHVGQGWLAYHLHSALARRGVTHYLLRVLPTSASAQALPRTPGELRRYARPGETPALVERVGREIAGRHLPLLVDVPGALEEVAPLIMAACTGAILVAEDAAGLARWRDLADSQALPLLAELRVAPDDRQPCDASGPRLRGTLDEQGSAPPSGRCVEELIERLERLCRFDAGTRYRLHRSLIDLDPLQLQAAIHALPAHPQPDNPWRPAELPAFLAELPTDQPLAVYGAAPAWLVAASAMHNNAERFILYNVPHGWIRLPILRISDDSHEIRLRWSRVAEAGYTSLVFAPAADLEPADLDGTAAPAVDLAGGVILGGDLPDWLAAALGRAYAGAAWCGVVDPALGQVVIVYSRRADVAIGSMRGATRNEE